MKLRKKKPPAPPAPPKPAPTISAVFEDKRSKKMTPAGEREHIFTVYQPGVASQVFRAASKADALSLRARVISKLAEGA